MTNHKFKSVADQLNQLIKDVESSYSELEKSNLLLIEEQHKIEAHISRLTEEKASISAVYKQEVDGLKLQASTLQADIATFDAKKQGLLKDVDELIKKKTSLSMDVSQEQTKMKLEREALASRTRELDEREQNLRIRESKVELGESKIMRNSNLLKL